MAAKPPRAPRTVEQATDLLERVSRLDSEAATIAGNRDAAIAATNAVADALLLPVLEERTATAAVLEAWWSKDGKTLLTGKRKTVELGGCMIGTKAASTSLTFTADDFEAAVKALQAQRWAKPYVSTKVSVDKAATKKALEGMHGEHLRSLGFGTSGGADVLVLATVAQAGTVAA